MQSRLLWVFAFVSGKNVDSFFEVDANGPLALKGSVEGDPFKKTGRELRRIKEDDSGERLGFLSKMKGDSVEGSQSLNDSDLDVSIPRQLGTKSISTHNAHEVRRDNDSSQPPEGTQQQEPAAVPSGIPHRFVPEERTEVPEEDNCAIPCNTPHGLVAEEKTEVREEDNCAICLEPKNKELIAPFTCAHNYHKSCVLSWIPINPTCPSCRTKLESDSPYASRPTEFLHLNPNPQLGTFRLQRQNALDDADLRADLPDLDDDFDLDGVDLDGLDGSGTFRLQRQNAMDDADLRADAGLPESLGRFGRLRRRLGRWFGRRRHVGLREF